MRLLTPRTANAIRWRTVLPALYLMVGLFILSTVNLPSLASRENLLNLANQQVSLIAVTLGQVLVMLTGGLDLSVGSVVSLSTAICSLDIPPIISSSLALVLATLVGFLNALGVTHFRVHPILMTLSTMTAVQGVTLMLRPIPGGHVGTALTIYANSEILGLPSPVWIALVLVVLMSLLLHTSRFGLHLYAVGGSAANAELGGVRTKRTITLAYVLCSLCASLGGINLTARIGSGDPLVGLSFATDSIAAAALGGIWLSGGMGTMIGPVVGLTGLALLGNGLNFLNVSTYYQMVVKGALLILVVSTQKRSTIGL